MRTHYLGAALLAALPMPLLAQSTANGLDPKATVERINHNYNATVTECREPDTDAPRGHYYCSGVTLRMVDDGPFNPWDYSEFAKRTGATSYTWLRKDLSIDKLVRPAGFILRTPSDAHALNLPVMETGFMCIYAFDGFTGSERRWHGCGTYNQALPENHQARSATVPANRNQALAWGSCDSRGIDTADQWRQNFRYVRTDMNRIQVTQCSWNAEQPGDWNAMVDVHQNPGVRNDYFARPDQSNELMLRNASENGDGSARLPYIEAFVWNVNSTYVAPTRGDVKAPAATGGLEPARNFQRKLHAQGYAVPIVRVDFTKPASERFSYAPEDQVIALGSEGAVPRRYIQSADWALRLDPGTGRQEWTLTVIPSAAGKAAQVSGQQALYDELQALRGNDPQWRENETSPGSMRQQLSCLIGDYPAKTVWNLEPFRPTVSAAQASKAGCNPFTAQSSALIAASNWSQFTDNASGQQVWGLRVVPSQAGRSAASEALYEELLRLRGRDREWQEGGPGSMRIQLACLQANYRSKAEWNLEPYRPAVTAAQAKAQGCNPT